MSIYFTAGTIERLTEHHLTLILYNKDELVYTSTIGDEFAAGLVRKYPLKIKLINETKINNQL